MQPPADNARARRGRFRPRSIIGLVLAAFALVALPLIVAIGTGLFYVDSLYQQSERLVIQGVTVTRQSRHLASLVVDMERSARQYRVLDDPRLIDRFADQAEAVTATLNDLAGLDITGLPDRRLASLARHTRAMASHLRANPGDIGRVIDDPDTSRAVIEDLAARGRRFVRERLTALRATATTARHVMLVCLFALVPIVIALAVFLGFLIARPMREIVAAIRSLGEGDMRSPIEIGAPVAEFDRIGERLDWMRARLVDQEAQKQQFLRHMSHELKTPLASIREGSALLVDGSLGGLSAPQTEVAHLVDSNTQELTNLIDNLLNFAGWQDTQVRLDIAEVDVSGLIEAQVDRHRLVRQARGLTVHTPTERVTFALDIDRMQLIVDNLLTNALKYAPEDSDIRLTLERDDDGLDLYVIDEGAGVPEVDRRRIFQAFERGERPAAGRAHLAGTGIGLSVVRECAEAHGGYAEVAAHSVYSSVFHVHIPHPTNRAD